MEAWALLLGSLLVRGSTGVTVVPSDTNHKHASPKVAVYEQFWTIVHYVSVNIYFFNQKQLKTVKYPLM